MEVMNIFSGEPYSLLPNGGVLALASKRLRLLVIKQKCLRCH